MKFGFNLLGVGPRSYSEAGRKADEAGYESVWIPEHLVWPSSLPSDSPYSADGKWPIDTKTPLYDPWVSLSFIAACSQRVRLGTYIYILPLRNPFVTARAVTTLDRVSQGRVILGIGVGWFKEEFEAVGESWGDRGKRADETIVNPQEAVDGGHGRAPRRSLFLRAGELYPQARSEAAPAH